jgi:hypothetical protein
VPASESARTGDEKVDLHTPKSLSRYFRESVLHEAEVHMDILWEILQSDLPTLVAELDRILD